MLPRRWMLTHCRTASSARSSAPFWGRDLWTGRKTLRGYTLPVVSRATGVSSSYIAAAASVSGEERSAILRGERPLIARKKKPTPSSREERLADLVHEFGGKDAAFEALVALTRV